MTRRAMILPFLALVALTGCATFPTGPSVLVLPTPGKPFEQFLNEEAICRSWAERQVGLGPQQAYEGRVAGGAAAGTLLGAGAGALLGAATGHAGAGAAIGAGTGLLFGSASGADAGYYHGYQAQRYYDTSYLQCMYSYGNQVPGTVRRNYSSAPRATTSAPPAPSGVTRPPAGFRGVPPDYVPGPGGVEDAD